MGCFVRSKAEVDKIDDLIAQCAGSSFNNEPTDSAQSVPKLLTFYTCLSVVA